MARSIPEVFAQLAAALEPLQLEIPDLNIYDWAPDNPTPPCLDMYPAPQFQEGSGMGVTSKRIFVNVRARAGTADSQSAQQVLLRLLDPTDPASVEAALLTVQSVNVENEGVTGFEQYAEDSGAAERMIGSQWLVGVFL